MSDDRVVRGWKSIGALLGWQVSSVAGKWRQCRKDPCSPQMPVYGARQKSRWVIVSELLAWARERDAWEEARYFEELRPDVKAMRAAAKKAGR